jgi:hypothetical protein
MMGNKYLSDGKISGFSVYFVTVGLWGRGDERRLSGLGWKPRGSAISKLRAGRGVSLLQRVVS